MFHKWVKKALCLVIAVAVFWTSVDSGHAAELALGAGAGTLPTPGQMVALSSAYQPSVLQGIKVYPSDPFRLDFLLDPGDGKQTGDRLKDETSKLIKYFLASLTIPEKDLWVNLSPYEKERIITNEFGLTEMGRDLLAQDYLLKQLTASVIYPEGETGKKFWSEVYKKAYEKYGTTDIPVDTFNKVWIVPEQARVYEKSADTAQMSTDASLVAYVVGAKLKVMLEGDYLAAAKDGAVTAGGKTSDSETQDMAKEVVREVVIPVLEREVNEGANFIQLRQVYRSLILASWYKRKIKGSLLSAMYVDRKKVKGVNIDDPRMSEKIWEQYVEAFKKGAYNFIKEEQDQYTGETIPRKYFSGGFNLSLAGDGAQAGLEISHDADLAMGAIRSVAGALLISVALSSGVPLNGQTPPQPAAAAEGQGNGYLQKLKEQQVQKLKEIDAYNQYMKAQLEWVNHSNKMPSIPLPLFPGQNSPEDKAKRDKEFDDMDKWRGQNEVLRRKAEELRKVYVQIREENGVSRYAQKTLPELVKDLLTLAGSIDRKVGSMSSLDSDRQLLVKAFVNQGTTDEGRQSVVTALTGALSQPSTTDFQAGVILQVLRQVAANDPRVLLPWIRAQIGREEANLLEQTFQQIYANRRLDREGISALAKLSRGIFEALSSTAKNGADWRAGLRPEIAGNLNWMVHCLSALFLTEDALQLFSGDEKVLNDLVQRIVSRATLYSGEELLVANANAGFGLNRGFLEKSTPDPEQHFATIFHELGHAYPELLAPALHKKFGDTVDMLAVGEAIGDAVALRSGSRLFDGGRGSFQKQAEGFYLGLGSAKGKTLADFFTTPLAKREQHDLARHFLVQLIATGDVAGPQDVDQLFMIMQDVLKAFEREAPETFSWESFRDLVHSRYQAYLKDSGRKLAMATGVASSGEIAVLYFGDTFEVWRDGALLATTNPADAAMAGRLGLAAPDRAMKENQTWDALVDALVQVNAGEAMRVIQTLSPEQFRQVLDLLFERLATAELLRKSLEEEKAALKERMAQPGQADLLESGPNLTGIRKFFAQIAQIKVLPEEIRSIADAYQKEKVLPLELSRARALRNVRDKLSHVQDNIDRSYERIIAAMAEVKPGVIERATAKFGLLLREEPVQRFYQASSTFLGLRQTLVNLRKANASDPHERNLLLALTIASIGRDRKGLGNILEWAARLVEMEARYRKVAPADLLGELVGFSRFDLVQDITRQANTVEAKTSVNKALAERAISKLDEATRQLTGALKALPDVISWANLYATVPEREGQASTTVDYEIDIAETPLLRDVLRSLAENLAPSDRNAFFQANGILRDGYAVYVNGKRAQSTYKLSHNDVLELRREGDGSADLAMARERSSAKASDRAMNITPIIRDAIRSWRSTLREQGRTGVITSDIASVENMVDNIDPSTLKNILDALVNMALRDTPQGSSFNLELKRGRMPGAVQEERIRLRVLTRYAGKQLDYEADRRSASASLEPVLGGLDALWDVSYEFPVPSVISKVITIGFKPADRAMAAAAAQGPVTLLEDVPIVNYPERYSVFTNWLKENSYLPLAGLGSAAIVDVASSYGYATVGLAKTVASVAPSAKVYGVDPGEHGGIMEDAEPLPANLTFLMDDHRLANVRINEPIKVMTVFNLIRHLYPDERRALIEQMGRNLAEGGLLIAGDGGPQDKDGPLEFMVFQKVQNELVPRELVYKPATGFGSQWHLDSWLYLLSPSWASRLRPLLSGDESSRAARTAQLSNGLTRLLLEPLSVKTAPKVTALSWARNLFGNLTGMVAAPADRAMKSTATATATARQNNMSQTDRQMVERFRIRSKDQRWYALLHDPEASFDNPPVPGDLPTQVFDFVEEGRAGNGTAGYVMFAPFDERGYRSADGRLRLQIQDIKLKDDRQRQNILQGLLDQFPGGTDLKVFFITNEKTYRMMKERLQALLQSLDIPSEKRVELMQALRLTQNMPALTAFINSRLSPLISVDLIGLLRDTPFELAAKGARYEDFRATIEEPSYNDGRKALTLNFYAHKPDRAMAVAPAVNAERMVDEDRRMFGNIVMRAEVPEGSGQWRTYQFDPVKGEAGEADLFNIYETDERGAMKKEVDPLKRRSMLIEPLEGESYRDSNGRFALAVRVFHISDPQEQGRGIFTSFISQLPAGTRLKISHITNGATLKVMKTEYFQRLAALKPGRDWADHVAELEKNTVDMNSLFGVIRDNIALLHVYNEDLFRETPFAKAVAAAGYIDTSLEPEAVFKPNGEVLAYVLNYYADKPDRAMLEEPNFENPLLKFSAADRRFIRGVHNLPLFRGSKNDVRYAFHYNEEKSIEARIAAEGRPPEDIFNIVPHDESGRIVGNKLAGAGILRIAPLSGQKYFDATGRLRIDLRSLWLFNPPDQKQGIFSTFLSTLPEGSLVRFSEIMNARTIVEMTRDAFKALRKAKLGEFLKKYEELEARLPSEEELQEIEASGEEYFDQDAFLLLDTYKKLSVNLERTSYQLPRIEEFFERTPLGLAGEKGGLRLTEVTTEWRPDARGVLFPVLLSAFEKPEQSSSDEAMTAVEVLESPAVKMARAVLAATGREQYFLDFFNSEHEWVKGPREEAFGMSVDQIRREFVETPARHETLLRHLGTTDVNLALFRLTTGDKDVQQAISQMLGKFVNIDFYDNAKRSPAERDSLKKRFGEEFRSLFMLFRLEAALGKDNVTPVFPASMSARDGEYVKYLQESAQGKNEIVMQELSGRFLSFMDLFIELLVGMDLRTLPLADAEGLVRVGWEVAENAPVKDAIRNYTDLVKVLETSTGDDLRPWRDVLARAPQASQEKLAMLRRVAASTPGAVETDRAMAESILSAKTGELQSFASMLETLFPETRMRWRKAAEVPWRTLVRDPSQPEPLMFEEAAGLFGDGLNQFNYWINQHDVRESVLWLMLQLSLGDMPLSVFTASLERMHRALLVGKDELRWYFPPTFLTGGFTRGSLKQLADQKIKTYDYGRLERIQQLLQDVVRAKDIPTGNDLVDTVANMYSLWFTSYEGTDGYLFSHGNNALAVNIGNAILGLYGLNGVSFNRLDFMYVGVKSLEPANREKVLRDELRARVREANPDKDLSRSIRELLRSRDDRAMGAGNVMELPSVGPLTLEQGMKGVLRAKSEDTDRGYYFKVREWREIRDERLNYWLARRAGVHAPEISKVDRKFYENVPQAKAVVRALGLNFKDSLGLLSADVDGMGIEELNPLSRESSGLEEALVFIQFTLDNYLKFNIQNSRLREINGTPRFILYDFGRNPWYWLGTFRNGFRSNIDGSVGRTVFTKYWRDHLMELDPQRVTEAIQRLTAISEADLRFAAQEYGFMPRDFDPAKFAQRKKDFVQEIISGLEAVLPDRPQAGKLLAALKNAQAGQFAPADQAMAEVYSASRVREIGVRKAPELVDWYYRHFEADKKQGLDKLGSLRALTRRIAEGMLWQELTADEVRDAFIWDGSLFVYLPKAPLSFVDMQQSHSVFDVYNERPEKLLVRSVRERVKAESATPYPLILGGAPGRGKSTLAANVLKEALAQGLKAVLISTDAFLYSREKRRAEGLRGLAAYDLETMRRTVNAIKDGSTVSIPVYNPADGTIHSGEPVSMKDTDLVIIEGSFSMAFEELRSLNGLKAFLYEPDDVGYWSRVSRDQKERGYSPLEIATSFLEVGRSEVLPIIIPTIPDYDWIIHESRDVPMYQYRILTKTEEALPARVYSPVDRAMVVDEFREQREEYFQLFDEVASAPGADPYELKAELMSDSLTELPAAVQKRWQELAEVSRFLGKYVTLHNVHRYDADRMMRQGGYELSYQKEFGFVSYDFQNPRSVMNGLAKLAGQFTGLEFEGWAGDVFLHDFMTLICDPANPIVQAEGWYQGVDEIHSAPAMGYKWVYKKLSGNLKFITKIDLSLDPDSLDFLVGKFMSDYSFRHPDTDLKVRQHMRKRFKQVALIYYWLGRLAEGFKEYQADRAMQAAGQKTVGPELAIFNGHEQAYYHIVDAIKQGKIPSGLTLMLIDEHSDNRETSGSQPWEANWLTYLLEEKHIAGAFWLHPEDRVGLLREDEKTFVDKGSDLRRLVQNNLEVLRRGIILSLDMDYFASAGTTGTPYRPKDEEIRQKVSEIFALFKEFEIPVYLVNGAYSTAGLIQYAPRAYENEFRNVLEETINNYDRAMASLDKVEAVAPDARSAKSLTELLHRTDDLARRLSSAPMIPGNTPSFVKDHFSAVNSPRDLQISLILLMSPQWVGISKDRPTARKLLFDWLLASGGDKDIAVEGKNSREILDAVRRKVLTEANIEYGPLKGRPPVVRIRTLLNHGYSLSGTFRFTAPFEGKVARMRPDLWLEQIYLSQDEESFGGRDAEGKSKRIPVADVAEFTLDAAMLSDRAMVGDFERLPELFNEAFHSEVVRKDFLLEKLSLALMWEPIPGFEERRKILEQAARPLGKLVTLHNTRRQFVDSIMQDGVRQGASIYQKLGTVTYDFHDPRSISQGLLRGARDLRHGDFGSVDIKDVYAIVTAPDDEYITEISEDIQRNLSLSGYSWNTHDYWWPVRANYAIDLSLNDKELSEIQARVEEFAAKHAGEVSKDLMANFKERLTSIAVTYLWMGRLIEAFNNYKTGQVWTPVDRAMAVQSTPETERITAQEIYAMRKYVENVPAPSRYQLINMMEFFVPFARWAGNDVQLVQQAVQNTVRFMLINYASGPAELSAEVQQVIAQQVDRLIVNKADKKLVVKSIGPGARPVEILNALDVVKERLSASGQKAADWTVDIYAYDADVENLREGEDEIMRLAGQYGFNIQLHFRYGDVTDTSLYDTYLFGADTASDILFYRRISQSQGTHLFMQDTGFREKLLNNLTPDGIAVVSNYQKEQVVTRDGQALYDKAMTAPGRIDLNDADQFIGDGKTSWDVDRAQANEMSKDMTFPGEYDGTLGSPMDLVSLEAGIYETTGRNWFWDIYTPAMRQKALERARNIDVEKLLKFAVFNRKAPPQLTEDDIEAILVKGSYLYGIGDDQLPTDIDITVIVKREKLASVKTAFSLSLKDAKIFKGQVTRVPEVADILYQPAPDPARSRTDPYSEAISHTVLNWGNSIVIHGKDLFTRRPSNEIRLAKALQILENGVYYVSEASQGQFQEEIGHRYIRFNKALKRVLEADMIIKQISPSMPFDWDVITTMVSVYEDYKKADGVQAYFREKEALLRAAESQLIAYLKLYAQSTIEWIELASSKEAFMDEANRAKIALQVQRIRQLLAEAQPADQDRADRAMGLFETKDLPGIKGFRFRRGALFGSRWDWVRGKRYDQRVEVSPDYFHKGVDIFEYITQRGKSASITKGTPIRSLTDGVVLHGFQGEAEENQSVWIKGDDGLLVRYEHVTAQVPAGARVKKGQVIALFGTKMSVMRNHLHLETWIGGRMVKAVPIRADFDTFDSYNTARDEWTKEMEKQATLTNPLSVFPELLTGINAEEDRTLRGRPIDRPDPAMRGGIDLNPVDRTLNVDNAGPALQFNIDPAMLEKLDAAPGITPVIINIQPMNDVRQFLGLREEEASSSAG